MPRFGPRWFIATLNPTRNWCYREVVKPVHDFGKGIVSPKLMCEVDGNGEPVLIDGIPTPIIELFEGSTYENVENVGQDYIKGMLSTYTGSMRRRFVYGEWGALQGLVYPQFDEGKHVIDHEEAVRHLNQLRVSGYDPTILEGYDHGLMRESCYGLFYIDDDGNTILLDGFYQTEQTVSQSAIAISRIRASYDLDDDKLSSVWADPDVFRRKTGDSRTVGQTIANLFSDEGIRMQRGNNDISSGIAKNWQYLSGMPRHEHPITGVSYSPYFYVSNKCQWFIDEITEYYFQRDTSDELLDRPVDRRDHSMDMWKYAMTPRPRLAKFVKDPKQVPAWLAWHEIERMKQSVKPRHR
jgi:hypothetical protein